MIIAKGCATVRPAMLFFLFLWLFLFLASLLAALWAHWKNERTTSGLLKWSVHPLKRPAQKCRTKIKKKEPTFFLSSLSFVYYAYMLYIIIQRGLDGRSTLNSTPSLVMFVLLCNTTMNQLPASDGIHTPPRIIFTFSFYLPIEHHTFSKSIIIVRCAQYLSIFWVNFITLRLYVYNFEQNKQTSTRFYIVCEREDGIALKWFLHRLLQHETSGEKRQQQCLTCYKFVRGREEKEREKTTTVENRETFALWFIDCVCTSCSLQGVSVH